MSIPHKLAFVLVSFTLFNVALNMLFLRSVVREGKITESDMAAMQTKAGWSLALFALSAVGVVYTSTLSMTSVLGFIASHGISIAVLIGLIHAGVFMALTAKSGHLLFKQQVLVQKRRVPPTL